MHRVMAVKVRVWGYNNNNRNGEKNEGSKYVTHKIYYNKRFGNNLGKCIEKGNPVQMP